MKLYQILPNGYLGEITEVPDETIGLPPGRTNTIPPEIPEGKFAYWAGTHWSIVEYPPFEPVVVEGIEEIIIDDSLNQEQPI